MPRVKRGIMTHKRHKKVLARAKGYVGGRRRLFKTAKEAVMHAGQYAYNHRRERKRDFRRLWITRISAACKASGLRYSRFIEGLNKAGINLNRKVLADMAVRDGETFARLVEQAKASINV